MLTAFLLAQHNHACSQERGFLAVLIAEIQQQIALLKRAGPEQVEGGLAQVRTVCLSAAL